MEKSTFFFAATLIQSWFKDAVHLFITYERSGKKSKDLIKDHKCCLIKIPYVNPLVKNLSLEEYFVSNPNKKQKPHIFKLNSNSSLNLVVDSSESKQEEQNLAKARRFPQKMKEKPLKEFKEHLLAAHCLEQLTAEASGTTGNKQHAISIVTADTPIDSNEPFPHDWIFRREEERQFQIDRVIKNVSQ